MSLTVVGFYKSVHRFTSVVVPPIFIIVFAVERRTIVRPSRSQLVINKVQK